MSATPLRNGYAGRLVALSMTLLAVVSFLPEGARASTSSTTYTAAADALVSSIKPNRNFGSAIKLGVQATPTYNSYVRFDVQGLSGTVTSANLQVYAVTGSTTGYDVRAVTDNSWQETTITFANAPPASDAVTGSSGPITRRTWTNVDITSLVQGDGSLSVALTTTSSTLITLASRESGAMAPNLVVETATDTEPPTTPQDLTAAAPTGIEVDLSWSASTDNVGVTGYTVYRDGSSLGTVDGATTAYADTTVSPGVTYSYTVDAFDAEDNHSPQSDPVSVTTPSDPVVAAVGNIACDPADPRFNGGNGTSTACRELSTSDIVANDNLSAVLALGDTQYECGGGAAYTQSYDPTWGRVKSITHPAIGNHEYYNSADDPDGTDCSPVRDARGYFDYFGPAAGDRSKGYYSFDVGAWHIISLNSNCWKIGGCGSGSPQERWLSADLAAHPNACTLAVWHHPRFSSGKIGNNPVSSAFWQDLYAAGADLVLTAHDHDFERFAPQDPNQLADPNGIREFVLGTGGKSLGFFVAIQPNSEVRDATTFGVLLLTLHPTSYDWQFVPVSGGTFTDSGSTQCH